jgi:hypothetical protein
VALAFFNVNALPTNLLWSKVSRSTVMFERMPEQNVVSWTAIIAGYSQNGHPHEALAFSMKCKSRV